MITCGWIDLKINLTEKTKKELIVRFDKVVEWYTLKLLKIYQVAYIRSRREIVHTFMATALSIG